MIRFALAFVLAEPAAAQDLDSALGVLNHFTARCVEVGADPSAAQAASPGSATVTSADGSIVIHYESRAAFDNFIFRRLTFAGGINTDCSLLLNGEIGTRYHDLGALIAQNAQTLLGPDAVASGDPTPGKAVQVVSTPGYPPAAILTHAQGPDYVELSLMLKTTPFQPVTLQRINADTCGPDPSITGAGPACPNPTPMTTPQPHTGDAVDLALK